MEETFGSYLTGIREKRGISLNQAARQINTSSICLGKIEAGVYLPLTKAEIDVLAKGLRLSAREKMHLLSLAAAEKIKCAGEGEEPTFGKRLREYREENGISIQQLSKTTGIIGANISAVEIDNFNSAIQESDLYVLANEMGLSEEEKEELLKPLVRRKEPMGEKRKHLPVWVEEYLLDHPEMLEGIKEHIRAERKAARQKETSER